MLKHNIKRSLFSCPACSLDGKYDITLAEETYVCFGSLGLLSVDDKLGLQEETLTL